MTGESRFNFPTLIAAILISVVLSVAISYYVIPRETGHPSTEDPQDEQGIQGIEGETGSLTDLPIEDTRARAKFIFWEALYVRSWDDELLADKCPVLPFCWLDIYNEDDSSDTVLSGLSYRAEANNITWINWRIYSYQNDKGAGWDFPPEFTIPEDEELFVEFRSNNIKEFDLTVSLSRMMNETVFQADGYQLANFTLTFTDTDYDGSGINIRASEHEIVNPTIVLGSFWTDAPLEWWCDWPHSIDIGLENSLVEEDVEYHFSVVVKVELTDEATPPITYKPGFIVSIMNTLESRLGDEDYTAGMPTDMMPDYVTAAWVSTYTSNVWTLERAEMNEGCLEEVIEMAGP